MYLHFAGGSLRHLSCVVHHSFTEITLRAVTHAGGTAERSERRAVGMGLKLVYTITCVNFADLNKLGTGKGLWAYFIEILDGDVS